MKRKTQPKEERRRRRVELNLLDEGRRLSVRRQGCGPFASSLLLLAAGAALLALGLH